ncbi:MAG TPA: A/G-specific adenine glycosylase [Planctomycetaceae bacterium]|nr:A/G-specific adenine glycosylase [Planctomycetaceae bacterium]
MTEHQLLSDEQCKELLTELLGWYEPNARDLPWRNTRDPYAIWVSEIMLQQTQVATVIDYYHRFLKQFPTVGHLAAADIEAVLSMWAGLGYYRRAKQLYSAAQEIVTLWGGDFPDHLDEIKKLPGVGRYTAGAIFSFAYDRPAPIVEANTARLYSRLIGLEQPTASTGAQRTLWEFAEQLSRASEGKAAMSNQALIELGSQVCKPVSPSCLYCPISSRCRAFALGKTNAIPPPKEKKSATPLFHAMVVIQSGDFVLLRQAGADEWWTGLWEFVRLDLTALLTRQVANSNTDRSMTRRRELVQRLLQEQFRWDAENWQLGELKTFKHAVTRYSIRLDCFSIDLAERFDVSDCADGATWKWEPYDNLTLPLTAPSKRVFKALQDAREQR